MKIKVLVEGILAGVVSAIFCYWALISPATLAAIAIRRKMPDCLVFGLNYVVRDVCRHRGFDGSSWSCVPGDLQTRFDPKSVKLKTGHSRRVLTLDTSEKGR